ncbi:MAG: valine--tRNA ligase [Thermoplasmatales archaeon B_DKE]|nr:MAG: valine--tRNA ligase [Thermoplasmatales archaeon B_DKE]QRF75619.1 Isoleucine--tRNA ligase [Thermoplasmatales archaeon]
MDLDIEAMESRWRKSWDSTDLYSYKNRADYQSRKFYWIDTPPPTVSGKMHMGHAFSYVHQDIIARYRRMKGYTVFYPWGFDDNGLPTERFTEKSLGIRAEKMPIGEFVAAAEKVSRESEKRLLSSWSRLGISADFRNYYTTVSEPSRRISQRMFLDLVKKDRVYRKEGAIIYCTTCRTAISQIEMKDAIVSTDFVYMRFKTTEGDIIIATTRPEMLGSCVAVFVNPSDKRYSNFIGKEAIVPIYGNKVRIYADESVDMEKGTGAEMVCTFGDQNDLEIWKRYNFDLRIIIKQDGKLDDSGPLNGLAVADGRKKIIELLESSGYIVKKERIKHSINTHERCGTPIEISIGKQWFVKYLDMKEDLISAGRKITWHPDHMRIRYETWVNGLKWDWCISRQRFYGVPFPVWYCNKCGETVYATESMLPVDPRLGNAGMKCTKCGSVDLQPETDIMDTWATSSLSPRLATAKDGLFDKISIMDIRFQGHDIITAWAFTTIVRSLIHDGKVPWENIYISGNVNDPYGQKMSKSKGNVSEPDEFITQFGADAIRFWSSTALPGEDIKIKEQEYVRGKRTVIKLHNATKLVVMLSSGHTGIIMPSPEYSVNRWIVSKLSKLSKSYNEHMENYQIARARSLLDDFFWNVFCDDYLEMIKGRVNSLLQSDKENREIVDAISTARYAMYTILRLYAPFMPYISDEAYHVLTGLPDSSSIHGETIEDLSGIPSYKEAEDEFDYLADVLSRIRAYKSSLKLSLSAPVEKLEIHGKSKKIELHADLLRDVMKITSLDILDAEEISVSVPA